ncbi:MAG: 30S ribosomal protein S5 [Candidatus Helarchaeota archaeon]
MVNKMAQGDIEEWVPKTRVGKLVKEGFITSINELFQNVMPIREPQIVDILLPNLKEEVLDINLVQKQTDAGEKSRFKATVAVGTAGFLGIGEAKNLEIGPAIRQAIIHAKLNIAPIRRGCGSHECKCGGLHSLPFKVSGKCGSVRVFLKPAPRGLGIVAAKTVKTIFKLAKIEDVWSWTKGHTKTTVNFAKATFYALKNTYKVMSPVWDWTRRE